MRWREQARVESYEFEIPMTSQDSKWGIAVSIAGPNEAEEISACLVAAFEPFRPLYTPEAFRDTVATPHDIRDRMKHMTVLIARNVDRETAGTLSFQIHGAAGHLRGVAVVPAFQGQGVAESLLSYAESALAMSGCDCVTLGTTEPLQRAGGFYRKNGFVQISNHGDYFGMRLIEYAKVLD